MGLYNWRSKLLGDWPMRHADHDPVNTLSVNRGRAGTALDAVFGAGAATPTKLTYRRGYDFDGADYMDCSVGGYQLTTGELSVMATLQTPPAGVYYIYSWENAGVTLVARLITTATEYRFYVGNTAAVNIATATRANYAVAVGQQHTVIGVHDGTDTLLYLNGELAATAATPLAPAATADPMRIGWRPDGGSNEYVGEMYHVGMADFALSPHQVAQYHREMMKRLHQI